MQPGYEETQSEKGAPTQRHALLIANPAAHGLTEDAYRFDDICTFLNEHSWQVDVHFTHSIEEARKRVRKAVEDQIDMVIAVGGDGTIHTTIQELAGSETILGVLPGGTFNTWARETGIPFDDAGAREILVNGRVRNIDLGHVNKQYFLLLAGVGFGARITHVVKAKQRKRFGILGYLLTAIQIGFAYPGFAATVKIDDQTIYEDCFQIVIGNTQMYGTAFKFTENARCDDGCLDVCIIRRPGRLARAIVMLDFLLRRKHRQKWRHYHVCQSVTIYTRKPLPFSADGEPLGSTPATFTIAPGALKVIVPQHTSSTLFSID